MTQKQMLELCKGSKVVAIDVMSDRCGYILRFDNDLFINLWDAGETEWEIKQS